MAGRVETLMRKLNEYAREVSDEEISPHLLKMRTEFERALEFLSGHVEWRRESDDALAKAVSQILDLVQVVEDIIDLYSHKGQAISRRKLEICFKMRQFLQKDPGAAGKVLGFAVGRISSVSGLFSGPAFPGMLKNFSDQVCSHLGKLLWHIEVTLENCHSDLNPEVQFTDELDGWESIEFELSHEEESERTSLIGSGEEIIGFPDHVFVREENEYADLVNIADMPEVGGQFSRPRRSWPLSVMDIVQNLSYQLITIPTYHKLN